MKKKGSEGENFFLAKVKLNMAPLLFLFQTSQSGKITSNVAWNAKKLSLCWTEARSMNGSRIEVSITETGKIQNSCSARAYYPIQNTYHLRIFPLNNNKLQNYEFFDFRYTKTEFALRHVLISQYASTNFCFPIK